MKRSITQTLLPVTTRFHLLQRDGLYRPIAFVFVTAQMKQDILQERQCILHALSSSLRVRQEKVFERYDPEISFRTFQDMLQLFGIIGRP
jgi:hypothetical protein